MEQRSTIWPPCATYRFASGGGLEGKPMKFLGFLGLHKAKGLGVAIHLVKDMRELSMHAVGDC
eukprot:scaffold2008_cov283-Pinguiococcus_pyrenoidosus.AAC.13